ncbi:RNase H family protein [Vibrio sp. SCSIO 43136]|uniref:RNase H family protein n=1 Tax=Vibrio sp. SCSIO 43136 TaxID=2819101 RepID=UPI002075C139|nr:RNase H family protein [Vibrio sp. SCSIO 43136]USD64508.1 hypothetical protein J4N39_10385 [Vibrio sp. SCSIO 43136]
MIHLYCFGTKRTGGSLGDHQAAAWAFSVDMGLEPLSRSGILAGGKVEGFRADLNAIVEGLKLTPIETKVTVYTRNHHVVKGMMEGVRKWQQRGWQTANKKPVACQELWYQLLYMCEVREVSFELVVDEDLVKSNELKPLRNIAKKALDEYEEAFIKYAPNVSPPLF